MPESFDLSELSLPEGSPFLELLRSCPDIELLKFQEGEYLTREGEATADTFLIVRGSYVVEGAAGQPSSTPAGILGSGMCSEEDPSFVGEMAYLGAESRTASVRSVGRTYTFCLRPRHVDILINDFPFFTRILCRQFTKRLKEADEVLKTYRERLALKAEQKFIESGEIVFRRNEPATCLYQLIQGKLVCEPTGADVEKRRPFIISGFVEPVPFLVGTTWPITVLAETNVVLVSIDATSRLSFVRNHPEVTLEALKVLAGEKAD